MFLELARSGRGASLITSKPGPWLRGLLPHEVLIKVCYAPIHPSDIGFIHGTYPLPTKPRPCVVGFEGSGYIEAVGEGLKKGLIGQKVAFLSDPSSVDGSFATKTIADYRFIHFLGQTNLSLEQAACFMLNPLSVILMVEEALTKSRSKPEALVNLFGSSQLGIMLSKYCKELEIPLMSVYRSEESMHRTFKTMGLYPLPFDKALGEGVVPDGDVHHMAIATAKQRLSKQKGPVTVLSASGDDSPISVLAECPPSSTLMYYGWMGSRSIGNVDIPWFMSNNHLISSFWLHNYFKEPASTKLLESAFQIEHNHKSIFHTKIGAIYPLENYKEGLREALKFQGGSKTLLKIS